MKSYKARGVFWPIRGFLGLFKPIGDAVSGEKEETKRPKSSWITWPAKSKIFRERTRVPFERAISFFQPFTGNKNIKCIHRKTDNQTHTQTHTHTHTQTQRTPYMHTEEYSAEKRSMTFTTSIMTCSKKWWWKAVGPAHSKKHQNGTT